ncbi:MAG TPA: APC family permease [Chlamydiales bacterium]|nr:APC family permease [Chlamydiales bacterium]
MSRKISFFSLSILIIAAIDSIRNLPSAALFGSSLIFFFMISAIIFFIPTALVAAELSASLHDKGGIYHWVLKAFGKKSAMAAIWLQWINTMVWYPSYLSFVAGTFAYLIHPELVHNKTYLVICILTIYWALTWVNLKGLHVSTIVNNICATVGTIFPMILLIILGLVWYFSGKPLQIELSADHIVPKLTDVTQLTSLVAVMASFLGIELAGVHVNDIRNPQRNFPRAVLIATLFILFSMILGSLAIAFVLPANQISLVAGVMQVFSNLFSVFGLKALIPVLTLCIGLGSIGTMINWLISPAIGLLHASEVGFLPPFFARLNKAGVAYNILIAQALLVSLFCLLFLLVPSVNAFYWFLTALSTELYMIMYILMFCAALRLHYTYTNRPSSFKIPGNNLGIWITSILGFIGCVTTIIVSFFPPEHINVGTPTKYMLMILVGTLITISPLLLFYRYQKTRN